MIFRAPHGKIPRKIPWEKIAIDRTSGMTWDAIAKKYGISTATLSIRRGESPVDLNGRVYMPLPWDEIAIDRNSGMSWNAIARKYGVSATTLHRRMAEFEALSDSGSGGVSDE